MKGVVYEAESMPLDVESMSDVNNVYEEPTPGILHVAVGVDSVVALQPATAKLRTMEYENKRCISA
jgi:hypothetical protein